MQPPSWSLFLYAFPWHLHDSCCASLHLYNFLFTTRCLHHHLTNRLACMWLDILVALAAHWDNIELGLKHGNCHTSVLTMWALDLGKYLWMPNLCTTEDGGFSKSTIKMLIQSKIWRLLVMAPRALLHSLDNFLNASLESVIGTINSPIILLVQHHCGSNTS